MNPVSKTFLLFCGLILTVHLQGTGSTETDRSAHSKSGCPVQFLNDSTFLYYRDVNNTTWIASQSMLFDYLPDGRLREGTNRSWNATSHQWIPVSRKNYLYGQYTGPEYIYLLSYNSGLQQWDSASRQVFSYLPDGKTDTATYQTYRSTGNWDNVERNIYAYDSGHQVLYQHETFNQSSASWHSVYRFQYSYIEDLQTGFVRQYWDTDSLEWINEYRKIFSHDDSRHLTGERLEYFDKENYTWDPKTRISYHYEADGHLDQVLYESWVDSTWKKSADYLYFYDVQGYDTLILFRIWLAQDQWTENYRYLYLYDDCGNLLSETGQYPDGEDWIDEYQFVYYNSPAYPPLHVEITDSTDVSCHGERDGAATASASGGTSPYTYLWDDDEQSITPAVSGLSGGHLYHVTVYDAAGDAATDSVFIHEPLPVITGPVTGDTLVQPGETHPYFVEAHPGSMYVWEITGGQPVEETNGPVIEVCWREKGTLMVTVTETDSSGCSGDPSSLLVYSGSTNHTGRLEETLHIYPNPVTHTLFIHLPETGMYDLQLFDANGKEILSRKNRGSGTIPETASLSPGIYLLRIRTGKKTITHLIVKQ